MRRIAAQSSKRARRLLLAFSLLSLGALSFLAQGEVEKIDLTKALQTQREAALLEANALRYRLESETLSTFYLVAGLGSYIGLNPDLTREQFDTIARAMLEARPGLINIAAAPDLVIRYIYPMEGNEAALGLDYAAHPDQAEAALRVEASGRPVVTGPVDLVQGGRAMVGRFPVYQKNGGGEEFWGIISTPLHMNALLERVGLPDTGNRFEFSIRSSESGVFYGPAELFNDASVLLQAQLFSNTWEIAAQPIGGWVSSPPNGWAIRVAVWGVFVLLAVIAILIFGYVERLEQSRAAEASVSQAKSRFLANISHEVRTPLNGIGGVAQILRSSVSDEEQRGWADIIVQSTGALNSLLSDILDLSRLENNRYESFVEAVAIDPFVDSVLGVIRLEAGRKGLELRYDGAKPSSRTVLMDAVAFRQILWNLLGNAVKFTSVGEVHLEIEYCGPEVRRGPSLRLIVSDTGVGIAKDRLDSIFGDFVQEDSSTTRRYGGTGLGLAIVKRLVDRLGGSVSVRSEKGRGSRFEAVLPVDRVASSPITTLGASESN